MCTCIYIYIYVYIYVKLVGGVRPLRLEEQLEDLRASRINRLTLATGRNHINTNTNRLTNSTTNTNTSNDISSDVTRKVPLWLST